MTCESLVDSRCRCSKASSSSAPLLACFNVRNLNAAHDAVVAEVQLMRIACVSDQDDEHGPLAMDQIASNIKGNATQLKFTSLISFSVYIVQFPFKAK